MQALPNDLSHYEFCVNKHYYKHSSFCNVSGCIIGSIALSVNELHTVFKMVIDRLCLRC